MSSSPVNPTSFPALVSKSSVPPPARLSSAVPTMPLSPQGPRSPSKRPPTPRSPCLLARSSAPFTARSLSPVADPPSPPLADRVPPLASAPSCYPFPQPSPPAISTLEKLIKTCPVWLQLGMSQERASLILHNESPGIFLVRKNMALRMMILSVRLSDQQGAPMVQEILIKEEKSLIHLEGSVLVFDNIFKLIAFYCVSRDILSFTLRLPQVIVQASKYEDMDIISSLGSNFWGSALNARSEDRHGAVPAGETEAGDGGARLWYVNPILMEEYFKGLASTAAQPKSRSQSLSTPCQSQSHPPGNPASRGRRAGEAGTPTETDGSGLKGEGVDIFPASEKPHDAQGVSLGAFPPPEPAVSISESASLSLSQSPLGEKQQETAAMMSAPRSGKGPPVAPAETRREKESRVEKRASGAAGLVPKKTPPPVPPPRKKKASLAAPAPPKTQKVLNQAGAEARPPTATPSAPASDSASTSTSSENLKGSDTSLHSPECGALGLSLDSCSNSSTEEEAELHCVTTPTMRRNPTVILDRAKQRLSMVTLPQVFSRFMKADWKLQKRIVELARDRDSYFGNLVRDYQTFTMETMTKHSSSTEMLQEIRQMLTQLKSYLIQSTELHALQEAAPYSEEKLETVAETALYKGVLKPIRESVYSVLRDIHTRDDSLQRLKENQQVVLNTTTTDLGITTSVPEAPVMEKIHQKLEMLHRKYSPKEKISLLLKTCKIIYESMSVGSPRKAHGADDFLPVLMYVLVRCNIAALLLDVEYMMELMDPALQLGEGSYYLTTTYGALEHIKSYDRQPPNRQLTLEIQDSIHRWERRLTHNKARLSRSSVQDFINVSFPDAGADPKTLCVCPNTTVRDLCEQCAGKFEVADPESHGLWVLVDSQARQLGPDELPLSVKSDLHYAEPRREYRFVYRPGGWPEQADLHDLHDLHDPRDSAHPETA
ncbi:ras and Rab interactor 3 [Anguilla anguilla]|uniref:ras and Rab interactor 3 n=1 Tax=Anguilla anguilla TaxID=7936 RepID=UPI0015AA09AF|nr:ras and Rab interactor 3 [Anguilla anguilla]XP_035240276.1 ras and Rab interactor 3 [Anguilla anguilla]